MGKRLKYVYHRNDSLPELPSNNIFVFGSNMGGFHKVDSSVIAYCNFGAEYGVGIGVTGRSYAIPVKDRFINPMGLGEIKKYVDMFKEYTHSRPDLKFWVSEVGSIMKEYKAWDMARLFVGCNRNCNFPERWRQYLK